MQSTEKKVFAGAKIKRLRREHALTQTRMAEDLGISPSYLNLIERNQRPISAQLLLRLADVFDIDLKALRGDDEARAAAELKEIFADPLFHGTSISNQELADLAATSPGAAHAVTTLYRAYREAITSAAANKEQNTTTDPQPTAEGMRFPIEDVRDFLHSCNNHFPDLEEIAESLWDGILKKNEDPYYGLRSHLQQDYGVTVRIMPIDVMPTLTRRFDLHSRRLFLSEIMDPSSRTFQIALQIALLGHSETINNIVEKSALKGDETIRLARISLANYFAGAVVMPYERFLSAAESVRYDVDILAKRFSASYEQICHRLTTLQRPGAKGISFFLIKLDHAGNISKRFSAGGFHFSRFGGTCPRWNVHDAFHSPGKIFTQMVEMPDGTSYFTVSRTVNTLSAGFNTPEKQNAIALGCELSQARRLVYADGLDLDAPTSMTHIGVNCRLCERPDCNQRAHPPLNRKLYVNEFQRGIAPYTFNPDE
jgi:predicted transcriptional regulator/transcriptional regulator with XRE-family HTH domain